MTKRKPTDPVDVIADGSKSELKRDKRKRMSFKSKCFVTVCVILPCIIFVHLIYGPDVARFYEIIHWLCYIISVILPYTNHGSIEGKVGDLKLWTPV